MSISPLVPEITAQTLLHRFSILTVVANVQILRSIVYPGILGTEKWKILQIIFLMINDLKVCLHFERPLTKELKFKMAECAVFLDIFNFRSSIRGRFSNLNTLLRSLATWSKIVPKIIV